MNMNRIRQHSLPAAGISFAMLLLALSLCLLLGCCTAAGKDKSQTAEEAASDGDGQKELTVGLLLTGRDAAENESVTASLEELAQEEGFRLVVYTPDVSAEEAEEASALEMGSFASCDVNPVEYQMLGINEFVAEDAAVIALHANHSEALESVLSAARGVGIRICAWGREVSEGSFDLYVQDADALSAAVRELLRNTYPSGKPLTQDSAFSS